MTGFFTFCEGPFARDAGRTELEIEGKGRRGRDVGKDGVYERFLVGMGRIAPPEAKGDDTLGLGPAVLNAEAGEEMTTAGDETSTRLVGMC